MKNINSMSSTELFSELRKEIRKMRMTIGFFLAITLPLFIGWYTILEWLFT